MKSSAIVCAIAAASLSFASLSFAQGYERHDRGDEARHEQRSDGDHRGYDQRDQRDQRHDQRGFDQRDQRHEQRDARNERQYGARGPQFYRGGRIPTEYRSRQYVVTNWRGHHLSAPPRGQQWVQVGADYVLIAIATGVIAQLILGQ